MSSPYMKISQLCIGYTSVLLENINLELHQGEFIPLLGPNGIGKTTFVKTLLGLIEQKSGSIELFGKNIEDYNYQERAKLIAVSLSESLHTGLMTCYEFISLGKLSNTDNDSVYSLMEKLNITALKDHPFNQLSDGQREWVKLARAMIQNTKIIFLDEPMSHLDIAGKVKMIAILGHHAKETGASILMSSHDWSTIRKFSSFIYVIDNNGVFNHLSPEDLILNKKLNEIYPLENKAMFEDNQGEISLKITARFKLNIIVKNELADFSFDTKKFWLEHALKKMGYNLTSENSLSDITIHKSSFEFEGESFLSISSLLQTMAQKI
jgi:iron complex transport system ATP-binding protein